MRPAPPRLRFALRVASGAAAGLGAWCGLGVPAFLDGAERLEVAGLLPPLWLLLVLLAAGAAAGARFRRPATPLLLLPLVALAPWIGVAPAMTALWTGPLLTLIWAALLIDAVADIVTGFASRVTRGAWLAAVATGIVCALFAWATAGSAMTGDQPHYLLVVESVLRDGDLDLANDYAEQRQRAYYAGPLEPRHVVLAPSGAEYPFHGLGVPFLVLPAFAVGGVGAVRVGLIVLAAFGVMWLWRAILALTSSPVAAWAGGAVLVSSFPFLAQSSAIYPDGAGAAITSFALLTLVWIEQHRVVSPIRLGTTGLALAVLPWLHIRLSSVAAIFGVAVLVLLARRPSWHTRTLVFLTAPLVSAVLLVATSWVMFETPDPTAAFRQKAAGSLLGAPRGLLGMLVDREFGLLPYAPAMAFAVAGFIPTLRSAPVTAWAGLAAVGGTLLAGASFVWWGGTSSPARFLVPVLPIVALPVGIWWTRASRIGGAACGTLIACAAVISGWVAVADGGHYVANDPDGRLSIFEWATATADLAMALPSLVRADASALQEALVAALWAALGVGAVVSMRRVQSRWPALNGVTVGAWAMVLWITAATTAAWSVRGQAPVTPDRSQLALLQASRHGWLQTGFVRAEGSRPPRDVVSRLAFRAPVEDEHVALHAPRVPPGRYRVELSPAETTASGKVTYAAEAGRDAWPLWISTPGSVAAAPEFTFVVPVHSVRVTAQPRVPDLVSTRLVVVAPMASPIAAAARRVTRYARLLVYEFDEGTTPETGGFWLAGERVSAVVIARDDGVVPPLAMTLEAGDQSVRVQLSLGSWQDERTLAAGARVIVSVPGAGGPGILQIRVTGARGRHALWASVAEFE